MKKYLILILPFLLIAIGILGTGPALTSAADSPVADSPVADSPVADSPVADSPVADSPVADSPVADSAVADSAVANTAIKQARAEKRTLQVRAATNPPETLRAGHDLELTIEVTFPETVRLDEIVWPAQWGTWDVVQSSTSDQLTANLGETTRTVKVLFRPTELGQVRIPPVPIFYSLNSGSSGNTVNSANSANSTNTTNTTNTVNKTNTANTANTIESPAENKAAQESAQEDGTSKQETGASASASTDETKQMVETRMFTIEVQSPIKPEDISLKSLASDNSLLSPRRHWSFWFVVILASIIVAGLIWSVWRAHRKRPSVEAVESPQEWATRALQKLLAFNLAHTNVKQFYIELTDIIRKFIERTTLVNAPELTTEEFLRHISLGNVFSDVERMKLKSFLEQADMVKFARYEPQEDLIRQSVYSAEIFIGIEKQDL